MAEEIALKRVYSGSDAAMLQAVSVAHGFFMKDLAAFSAFDATFTPEWAAQWLADIEAAEATTSARSEMYAVAGETELVVSAMQAGRNKWSEIKYFIQKAFPGDKAMLRLFGEGNYLKARMSQPRMMEFLLGLHSTATDHAAQLIAAGYTQERIDDILTAYHALTQKNDAQNKARRGRPRATAQRIAALNAPYLKMALVNRAAQLVFADSYASRKIYTYLPGRSRRKKKAPAPDAGAGV